MKIQVFGESAREVVDLKTVKGSFQRALVKQTGKFDAEYGTLRRDMDAVNHRVRSAEAAVKEVAERDREALRTTEPQAQEVNFLLRGEA